MDQQNESGTQAMTKNWRILLLGAVVSGAALLMIVSQIDLALLADALRGANYVMLLPALLVTGIGLAARAMRWRVLLSGGLPYWRAFHVLNVAYLVNGLLPLRIGELARVWLAWRGQPSVPMLKSAATVVVERLLDLLAVVLFIALGLALAVDTVPPALRDAGIFMGALSVMGFLTLVLLAGRRAFAQRILAFFTARIAPLRRFDLAAWLDHLLDGFAPLTRPVSLLNALLWTAISWGFSFLSGLIPMLVFYPEVDGVATLLFIAAASFAVALPAVPGNIGTYEASILLAMAAAGYTDTPAELATATAFAFSVHLINLAMNALLGVIGLLAEGVTLEQMRQGVRRIQSEPTE